MVIAIRYGENQHILMDMAINDSVFNHDSDIFKYTSYVYVREK